MRVVTGNLDAVAQFQGLGNQQPGFFPLGRISQSALQGPRASFPHGAGQQHGRQTGRGSDIRVLVGRNPQPVPARLLDTMRGNTDRSPVRPAHHLEVRNVDGKLGSASDFQCFLHRIEQRGRLVTDVRSVDAPVAGHDAGQIDQFVRIGIRSGNVDQPGGHAPSPLLHPLLDELAHAGQLLGVGFAADRTHHLGPDCPVGEQMDHVDPGPLFFQLFQVSGHLPLAAAAVAGDDSGAALGQVVGRLVAGFFQDGVVAVVVQVDVPGGDDQVAAVDSPLHLAHRKAAHGHDAVPADGHVAAVRLAAGTVDDQAAFQQQIGIHRGRFRLRRLGRGRSLGDEEARPKTHDGQQSQDSAQHQQGLLHFGERVAAREQLGTFPL